VGKIAEISNCAFDPWGCTGGAGVIAGAAGTSGLIAAQTIANAVSYATPTIAGFSGTYQTSVSTRTNERSVLSLNYANGPLAAQFLQSKNSANTAADALTVTAANSVVSNVTNNGGITDVAGKGTSIAASYDLGVAKVALFNAVTKDASDVTTKDITGLTASVPMGAYTLLAGYAKDKKAAATADTKVGLGVNYALSKRTTLGADVFKQDAVGGSTGYVVRVGHAF
jgi:hypothetical protein